MDTIANMLTSINNAYRTDKASVTVPYSKIKNAIAKVLVQNDFLTDVQVKQNTRGHKVLVLTLKYDDLGNPALVKLRRVSKPSLRVYAKAYKIPRPKGGAGMMILSTPFGVLSDRQARLKHTGGEVICEVIS